MDSLSVGLCLFAVLISVIYLYFKKSYAYWKNRNVTHLKPKIPLGNFPAKTSGFMEILHQFYAIKDDTPFVGGYFFTDPVLVATDLDFIQTVLIKEFSSFQDRGFYTNEVDDPLSCQLLAVDGEKWKPLRTKLSPTFTSGKMKFMFPTVVSVADRFVHVMSDLLEETNVLEVKDLLARFTTDIIGVCAFGIECNSMRTPNSEFRFYGKKVFEEPAVPQIFQPLMVQFPNMARKLHARFLKKEVSDFFLGTVRETIDFREKNNIRRNDFMDLLIKLKNGESLDGESKPIGKLTFEEVAAQAFVFFLAGFETSSTTMTFCLYELALNPDVQEKTRREILTVLGNHDGKLTYDGVKEMKYLNQVINETLRKYPPLVDLVRKCSRNYPVPSMNMTIEKGTSVFVPVYSIHHDPEIYPNPELFDPDRFQPEESKKRHPMTFLGFGDGPRNCIGMRFGRMQTQIGLVNLLKNFRFKTCPKTPITLEFEKINPILSPLGGLHLDVERL